MLPEKVDFIKANIQHRKNLTFGIKKYLPQIIRCSERRTLPPVISRDIFENGVLWTAAPDQSEISVFDVIRFLAIEITFGIFL